MKCRPIIGVLISRKLHTKLIRWWIKHNWNRWWLFYKSCNEWTSAVLWGGSQERLKFASLGYRFCIQHPYNQKFTACYDFVWYF